MYKQYPQKVYRLVSGYSHPPYQERIQKIDERIEKITGQTIQEVLAEKERGYTVTVYNNGEVVAAL